MDIFGFYRYLTNRIESKNHVLLESIDLNSQEMHFSFIGSQPDFIIKINKSDLKISAVNSEKGEKIRDLCINNEYSVCISIIRC